MNLSKASWTNVNLVLHMCARAVGCSLLQRSTFASMVGIFATFEAAPLLVPQCHDRLRRKYGLSRAAFYAGDFLVHIFPLYAFYVPHSGMGANCLGYVTNLAWGALLTGGSMDLSKVYCPIAPTENALLWGLAGVATLLAP